MTELIKLYALPARVYSGILLKWGREHSTDITLPPPRAPAILLN